MCDFRSGLDWPTSTRHVIASRIKKRRDILYTLTLMYVLATKRGPERILRRNRLYRKLLNKDRRKASATVFGKLRQA